MVLYFDTETTGLYPGEICQLSYIMQDKGGVSAKNFYFAVDFVEYGALKVHGLTAEKLNETVLHGGIPSRFAHTGRVRACRCSSSNRNTVGYWLPCE